MLLTSRDMRRLVTVHQDLLLVVLMAARSTTVPFMVMETSRSIEQQRINIKKGVSWTMRSRHLVSPDGLCRAADIVPVDVKGQPLWAWPVYYKLAPIIKAAAFKAGVPVEWGGDWVEYKDGPHWQLPWKLYP